MGNKDRIAEYCQPRLGQDGLAKAHGVIRWHIPPVLKRTLPRNAIDALRILKASFLSRDLSRRFDFSQSLEDVAASAAMSIVVPVHDVPVMTRRCFASLERYAPQSEIIVMDDASILPETTETIREFSVRNKWTIVRHEQALGHSESCRAGALHATRPYLCLLNSDTVVTPWCWLEMKKTFEQNEKVGIAGPSTSNAGTLQELALPFACRFFWNDNQICSFAHRLLAERREPVLMDLPWASGFALFIKRHLWIRLDGFDRNLKDYYNEVDLCKRASDIGYRSVWVRNSYIHHFGQQSYRAVIGKKGIRARLEAAEAYLEKKNCGLI